MSLIAVLLSTFAWLPAEAPPLQRYEDSRLLMGMKFKIVLYAPDEPSANLAFKAAFERVKQLNGLFSDYEPDSELMTLCRTAGKGESVPVGPELFSILQQSQELSRKSNGAFDITVGPIVRLWRQARRKKVLPPEPELQTALQKVGYQKIKLDAARHSVELTQAGMQLDLGGIAAGFAVDEVLALLKKQGIDRAMVDASGDIGVSGPPPGTEGWRIGIGPLEPEGEPSCYLLLKHMAVTTSGDAWQHVELNGKRYSHIVNPATGLGLTDRMSVTVVARDCTTADSYATAVCVLGIEAGIKLIDATPGAAVLIVREEADRVESEASKRLSDYLETAKTKP